MSLLVALVLLCAEALAAPRSNFELSKRVNLRYEDVIVTRDGTRWRGKILERGDEYRIRIAGNSEVSVPKEDIASVTRELHPGLLHNGQFVARVTPGVEGAVVIGEGYDGPPGGLLVVAGIAYDFGGLFEPELFLASSPIGPGEVNINSQFGFGFRYYLQTGTRAKGYTYTEFILGGAHQDLGLRTGPGFILDLGQNFGIGVNQGITLLTQLDPEAVAVGYHLGVNSQFRF
jgi:hypothetical protein